MQNRAVQLFWANENSSEVESDTRGKTRIEKKLKITVCCVRCGGLSEVTVWAAREAVCFIWQ